MKNALLKLDRLDGQHPLQTETPTEIVNYPVRVLDHGEVAYFNFDLAADLGLVKKNAETIDRELQKKLIETFSLRIVNEFDQEKKRFEKSGTDLKPKPYMATRYLQIQHFDKRGKTSGDGRAIWNGVYSTGQKTFDVSSRGTGVTCLAPGAVEASKPLKTGNEDFGYGCGLAEIDELYASALQSEIFYRQGIQTERMLAIIHVEKNYAIGVRVAENLLRPAHLFRLYRLNQREQASKMFHHFYSRQVENRRTKQTSYKQFVTDFPRIYSEDMARFAAKIERHHIFLWLDWDGDNVLLDPGIIDYGSIRQFGAFHHAYRYKDTDRYSTCLKDQKQKAFELSLSIHQFCHWLKTGERKTRDCFESAWEAEIFEKSFRETHRNELAMQIFGKTNFLDLSIVKKKKLERFFALFLRFESLLLAKKYSKVPDGINRYPIFKMRKLVKLLRTGHQNIEMRDVLTIWAKKRGWNASVNVRRDWREFMRSWKALRAQANQPTRFSDFLLTGNAVVQVIDLLVTDWQSKLATFADVQNTLDHLVRRAAPSVSGGKPKLLRRPDLFEACLTIAQKNDFSI